ncbi:unnamed protein product, partial [Effrenium voratum]
MGNSCTCDCNRRPLNLNNECEELLHRQNRIQEQSVFKNLDSSQIAEVACQLKLVRFAPQETIIQQGEEGLEFFIVEHGHCCAYVQEAQGPKEVREYHAGDSFGEIALLRDEPRAATVVAESEVACYRLSRDDFVAIIQNTYHKESLVRGAKLFETMTDEQVQKIAALLTKQFYKAGDTIIRQGEPGLEFFLLDQGECVATQKSFSSQEQEVMRYSAGEIFGEKALLEHAPRGATISAVSDVHTFTLQRADFEAHLGPMSQLKAQGYLSDPRKLLADFYLPGDARGPAGTLQRKNLKPDQTKKSQWFVVYRPCSRDSIAKMLGRVGVGKGLNVKGKSAKKNRLSAFVPFLQISQNEHKTKIEESPSDARTKIFYKTASSMETARQALQAVLKEQSLKIDVPEIKVIDTYEPLSYGLDVPEPLMREVYIMRHDISPVLGWETGRDSEPAFMDMNLHAVRDKSLPEVVLFQHDATDPMNPLGLLIAYAESAVKPVVSDFDTFTVGSRGFSYSPIPEKQIELIHWSLKHTEELLQQPTAKGWTGRWLDVLKDEANKGFHPTIPKYGFGDETSCSLIDDVVTETSACGAVRHGAECFNFYFPQELDQEFLIVWDGFQDPPWRSVSELELRDFLSKRVDDGYTFPFNPVWPVRDPGWYKVVQKLREADEGKASLKCWYPEKTGILKEIDRIHAKHKQCFTKKTPLREQSFSA